MYRKKHSICKVRYYPWFQASTGSIGRYIPQISGETLYYLQLSLLFVIVKKLQIRDHVNYIAHVIVVRDLTVP